MAVVARTYRGALRDLEHHGRIVVADAAGNVLYHYGDPYAITFARSAAKPYAGDRSLREPVRWRRTV